MLAHQGGAITFFGGVWANIVANAATALLIVLAARAWFWGTRRRLYALFGLAKERPRIVIYTSRLFVTNGGSLGPDGTPRTFVGEAVPNYEAELIKAFGAFFGDSPVIRWSGAAWLRWADIDVVVQVSPATATDMDRSATLITIGSPGYNCISEAVEQWGAPVRFAADNGLLQLQDGTHLDVMAGVLQSVVHPSSGQVAFYLAGPTAAGTSAAAQALIRDWKRLRKLGDRFYRTV